MLPSSPQDHVLFSRGWQKMDLLIIVPVHANERGAGKSIIAREECEAHTNARSSQVTDEAEVSVEA